MTAARDRDALWRWVGFAPALGLMLLLSVLPLLNLLWLSVHEVAWQNGAAQVTPAGLEHYVSVPADPLFRIGMLNTAVFAVCAVIGQVVLGFATALFCSRVSRLRVVYRTALILPILIPGIVVGAIWKLMLNFDFGPINAVLGLVGVPARDWLGDGGTALLSVIAVDIWHWTPFCFLLFLAGLESLPREVYEASQIDGAGFWQELRSITIPMMLPIIAVAAGFRLVLAFKVFDEVYLLTGGGPGTATQVISFTLYQRFFTENHAGYGAAMSVVVIFAVALLLIVGVTARRRSHALA